MNLGFQIGEEKSEKKVVRLTQTLHYLQISFPRQDKDLPL